MYQFYEAEKYVHYCVFLHTKIVSQLMQSLIMEVYTLCPTVCATPITVMGFVMGLFLLRNGVYLHIVRK